MPNHNGQEKRRINYIYAPMFLKWPSLEHVYNSMNIEFQNKILQKNFLSLFYRGKKNNWKFLE